MNYPNVLNAVTATTTSVTVPIQNDFAVTLMFVATGISAGNGVFQVDGMIGGIWVTQIAIVDLNSSNTNAQNQTRVNTVTLSSNTQKVYALDSQSSYEAIRIKVVVTTDGSYSCHVHTLQKR